MKFKIAGLVIFFLFNWAIKNPYSNCCTSATMDRQALLELYEATGGDGWSNNSGWGSGELSGWYGVQTDGQGRVTRIDLYKNNLRGQLPASIGQLTKLRYINLKGNALTGNIPSTIGDLASLEWLILSGNLSVKEPPKELFRPYHPGKSDRATNDFSGAIPASIGNLQNLKRFELSGSSITRIPEELYDCTALEGLYVSMNYNLAGSGLSESIGNLTNLQQLYMAANEFEGSLPRSLSRLTKLRYINLGTLKSDMPNNHFTGSMPDLSNLTELRSIILDANDLSGEWPQYWNNGNFDKLNTLRATWNSFSGRLHGFDKLPVMRSFDLSGNKLSGSIAPIKSISDGVIIIGLGWNNFTGELPQTGWPKFYQLRLVYLNNNELTGNIPSDLIAKADNKKLRWLYFQNNRFSSVDPKALANLKSEILERVDVSGNELIFEKHIKPAVNPLKRINFNFQHQTGKTL